jgi:hypothetical protein
MLCFLASTGHAQSVIGVWQGTTNIQVPQYSEPYVLRLWLAPNGRFEQWLQSLRFQGRNNYKVGTYQQIGPDVYRFALYGAQPGEMPAWNSRLILTSPTTMTIYDLTTGGSMQFSRLR